MITAMISLSTLGLMFLVAHVLDRKGEATTARMNAATKGAH